MNWDHRGAGKFFSMEIPGKTMRVQQFVDDIHKILQKLLSPFNKKKLFLVGHSWGTALGALAQLKSIGAPPLFRKRLGL
jgi:alpha-beta hydrolase superfamily lysophospholipase